MESEAQRIVGLYERHAGEWDRARGRGLLERAWLERMLALLPPEASILDLGCGSGEPIARFFIESGCALTGVDSSPTLIGLCRQRFPDAGWLVEDMRTLLRDSKFDGIVAWDSFFHLCPEDQRLMFPVFRRHIADQGALMFTSGPSCGHVIGTFAGEPLYHGSLDAAEYAALLDENGFDVVSHDVADPACGHHTVWLARLR
jgi:SAM-dependent methyltransferase